MKDKITLLQRINAGEHKPLKAGIAIFALEKLFGGIRIPKLILPSQTSRGRTNPPYYSTSNRKMTGKLNWNFESSVSLELYCSTVVASCWFATWKTIYMNKNTYGGQAESIENKKYMYFLRFYMPFKPKNKQNSHIAKSGEYGGYSITFFCSSLLLAYCCFLLL